MKRFLLLVIAALTPYAFSGVYVCKSQALTHKDDCPVVLGCPGNCKIYNWSRGYCSMSGFGDCYTKSAKNGGVARVDVEEHQCTQSYGCACERGDVVRTSHYTGKVDQCSSAPLIDGDPNPTGTDEDLDDGTAPAPAPAS